MSNEKSPIRGRVVEIQKNCFYVKFRDKTGKEIVERMQLMGSFKKDVQGVPVIGDYVMVRYDAQGVSTILEITDRRNLLKRPDQSGHAAGYVKTMKEQLLAANFDYLFIVVSLNKNFNLNRIVRYISLGLQSEAIPVVVLTKADLCDEPDKYIEEIRKISDKADIIAISAVTGSGLEQLERYMAPGKNEQSGVAKLLLSYIIKQLRAEGRDYLGVDCETLNPNALRFWRKYFEPYTYSYARRIDERICNYIQK